MWFNLSLQAIQLQVLGYYNSFECRYHLMEQALIYQISYPLVTLTSFLAPLSQHIFQARQATDQSLVAGFVLYFSFLFIPCIVPSCTKDMKMNQCRFYVVTRSTSLCSMICVGIVFINCKLHLFTENNLLLYKQTGLLGDLHGILLVKNSTGYQTNRYLKALFSDIR